MDVKGLLGTTTNDCPIEPTKCTIKSDDMGHMIIIGVHMRVGPSKEVVALSAQSTWPVPSLKLTCNAS